MLGRGATINAMVSMAAAAHQQQQQQHQQQQQQSSSGVVGGSSSLNNNDVANARYSGPGPIQRPPMSGNSTTSPCVVALATQQRVSATNAIAATNSSTRTPLVQQQTTTSTGIPANISPAVAQQRSSAANPTSAQQAKLRAEALSTTLAFFSRDGKCMYFIF